MTALVIDKDGGKTTYGGNADVRNVAPTATLSNNGPMAEGSAATVSFSAQSDPSVADTTAGLHYAYSCTNGDLSGATYAGSGTSASTSCAFNDNGSFTVKARIIDKDGGFTEYTTAVTVTNVAPTATLSNNGPVAEGSAATVSFSAQSDPSSADTTAGLHYAYSCTNGDLSGATYAGSGTSASTTCTYDDGPSTHTVKARIIDKDGGFTEYTTAVTVTNVAPTVSITGAPASSPEGTAISVGSTTSDPSSADTTAGFTKAWSVTKNASAYASGTGASFSFTPEDNGTYVVTFSATDKDGGTGSDSKTITVTNVAPTATLGNNGPVNEGTSATVSFSGVTDPSGVDAASLHYAFDCSGGSLSGATYAGSSNTTGSTTCPFGDNGSYQVTGKVMDKDGGSSAYATTVVVTNVNPTATLSNNGPASEGSPATVSFSGPFDPSSADTSAGFHYAFSCTNGSLGGATYQNSGTSASTNCVYADNGTHTARGRIIDKDGGYSEYTTSVVVTNVAPTVTSASFANSSPTCGTNNATLTVSFSDPGADTWSATISWNDGSPLQTLNSVTSPFSVQHTYNSGPQAATVTITDDDGGSSGATASTTVQVAYSTSGILQPINPGPPTSIWKYGSTIPVKVQFFDCAGNYPSNLAPTIEVKKISGSTPPSGADETITGNGSDTGNVMRWTGGPDNQYIYNLATKSLSDATATYQITITVPSTGQVVLATFGTRAK